MFTALHTMRHALRRATQISPLAVQEELYRIDKLGPRAMAGFVVGILTVIFVFGVVDFVQCLM